MEIIETTVSADAVRFFHEAQDVMQKGDLQQAHQLTIAALAEDPKVVGAWNLLGIIFHKWKRWHSAAAAFTRASNLAPTAIIPMMNRAWNLHLAGRSIEALPMIKQVTNQPNADALSWTNRSQIHIALDQVAEGIAAATKAVEIVKERGPKNNEDQYMPRLALALATLRTGDYYNGLRHYEARFPYALTEALKYPYPLWRGEDLSDKRLFIVGEQGVGDSVQFLRFMPAVAAKAKKVIVHIHQPAVRLYKENCPDNVEVHPIPRELPMADYYCPTISLPVGLNISNEEIRNSWWQYKLPDMKKPFEFPDNGIKRIGISWAGDPKHDNDRWRSMKLEDMLPLAELPNTHIYSLQVGHRRADLDLVGTHGVIKDLSFHINDVCDTMRIMQDLDAVVTVDTSVAHMAGSIGVKTLLLIPRRGLDWRWEEGQGKTCWYPNTTMIRQKRVDDWEYVIDRVKRVLN